MQSSFYRQILTLIQLFSSMLRAEQSDGGHFLKQVPLNDNHAPTAFSHTASILSFAMGERAASGNSPKQAGICPTGRFGAGNWEQAGKGRATGDCGQRRQKIFMGLSTGADQIKNAQHLICG